jgi:hypothetical protein
VSHFLNRNVGQGKRAVKGNSFIVPSHPDTERERNTIFFFTAATL